MSNYKDVTTLKPLPNRKKWLDSLLASTPTFSVGLGLIFIAQAASAAVLPLEFSAVPQVTDMAIGQAQTLSYTIHNQVQTRSLPLRSISVINAGDGQVDGTVTTKTTCGASIAPNGYCTITVNLNQPQAGTINRTLSIDYNGRAPLTSRINSTISTANYTVLIYIVGSNLESQHGQASFNIGQMADVGSSNKMNIVLETGGANLSGWKTVQRKVVYPGVVSILEDLGQPNMALPGTIQDFIEWGVTSFPAQKYALIFWDHGGGPNAGYGGDEIYGDQATPINQLSSVVQNVASQLGTHFEFIGFDTCLLGNAETYAGLYKYTNYLVGSEDLEPGKGWQYNTFLNYIQQNPAASGLEVGTEIVNGYTAQNSKDSTTLSVIDTAEMPNVLNAFDELGTTLSSLAPLSDNTWLQIARSRFRAPDYVTSVWDNNSDDVVDIVEFAAALQLNFPAPNAIYTAAANLGAAVTNAVKYYKNSFNREASHGLTVYYPSIMMQYKQNYPQMTVLNGLPFFPVSYTNFVNDYYSYYSFNTNSLGVSISGQGFVAPNYTATISSANYDELYAALGSETCNNVFDDNGNQLIVPCYSAVQSFANTPASATTINFNYADNINSWPMINATPIILIPNDTNPATPDEDTFLIPVVSQAGLNAGYLLALLDSNNQFSVVGFQENAGSSNTQGKTLAINNGDIFYLRSYVNNNNTWSLMRTTTTITAPFTVSFGAPPAANFDAFRFLLGDLTGALVISSASTIYPPV